MSLIDYEELETKFKVRRRTIQRWIRSLGFPRPVDLSPGTIRFYRTEVEAWERDRAGRRNSPPHLEEEGAFDQLNELLTEVTGTARLRA